MANSKKVTRTETVVTGVELSLSLDEARLLKSILGNIGTGDTYNTINKTMVFAMWTALRDADVVSVDSPFATIVRLK